MEQVKEYFKFQFHYGTIKSVLQSFYPSVLRCFNSTMVRLKDNYKPEDLFGAYGFQFHYGTIKRCTGGTALRGSIRFNSTMVRLKALQQRSVNFFLLFQFHYGTIKRT